jgi:beta-galactosidase/beta-glucuronidase
VHQHHVTDAVTLDILTRVALTPVNASAAPLTLAVKLFDKNQVLVASQNVTASPAQSSKNLQIISGKITINNPHLWYVTDGSRGD